MEEGHFPKQNKKNYIEGFNGNQTRALINHTLEKIVLCYFSNDKEQVLNNILLSQKKKTAV